MEESFDLCRPTVTPPVVAFLNKVNVALEKSGNENVVLKPAQVVALDHIFHGNDTMVLLPTGYGKSIIFQLLPWLLRKEEDVEERQFGIVLVVSPLNSLILDQIEKLAGKGVPVGMIERGRSNKLTQLSVFYS